MYFIVAQILFALWAILFAHFQTPCIKAMISYVPINNPFEKPFHNRGVLVSAIVCVIIEASLYALTRNLIQCALLLPAIFSLYKMFFDGIIGIETHKNFFFIGTTAKQDVWLHKHFPHGDGGEVKVLICCALVIISNLLNYLL